MISCRCAFCSVDILGASLAKHLKKKHLESKKKFFPVTSSMNRIHQTKLNKKF